MTSGEHAGEYLNWSYDVGYWLDDASRDTTGHPLVPFASAAADADVAGTGTSFRIDSCGTETDGSAIALGTCDRLRATRWRIVDGFSPPDSAARAT
ncbi:MAG: hypothetical protein ACRD3Q_03170 [Terriglobales bacterium]